MFACLKGLVVKVAIFAALIYGINLWLRVKDYHFDKNEIHKIGKQFIGKPYMCSIFAPVALAN